MLVCIVSPYIKRCREYFTNLRGQATNLAPFVGASLAAKASPCARINSVHPQLILSSVQIIFSDSNRHCVTKVDYNNHGPAAIRLSGGID